MDVLRAIHDRNASGLPCCGIGSVVEQRVETIQRNCNLKTENPRERERERTMRTTQGQQINAHPSEQCKSVMTSPLLTGRARSPASPRGRKGKKREKRKRREEYIERKKGRKREAGGNRTSSFVEAADLRRRLPFLGEISDQPRACPTDHKGLRTSTLDRSCDSCHEKSSFESQAPVVHKPLSRQP